MNERNKKYYKQAYDKVYASDELKERMINMGKEDPEENKIRQIGDKNSQKNYRRIWRAAVVAAVLAVVVPSGVFAAVHYWGVGDFFARINHTLTKEAEDLIEKDVVTQTKDIKSHQEMPVEFRVKETLCDSDSIYIVLEAETKEKGKYLLVPGISGESDNVAGLGIKEEKTIGEYAESKGLKLLYVDFGFDDNSELSSVSYWSDHVLVNDDTMDIYISARREAGNKNMNVTMECSVWGDEKATLRSTLNFKLQDKSSVKKVTYVSDEKMVVKGTKAVVTKVTMERTEVSTYVKVYYNYPDKDLHEEDGLFFRIRDEKGTLWNGGGVESTDKYLGDGKYCCMLAYNSVGFPKRCILEAFDCWETNVTLGQFIISKE